MIGYLNGKIIENSDGKLLIAVGPSESSVGYQVQVPRSGEYELQPLGKQIELYIHTHVREDALELYGFASRLEKDLFLTLLSVNGIGPKGAIGILSKASPGALIDAIMDGDKDALTRIPGIGKKTAERVVLELADPLRKKIEAGAFGERSSATKQAADQKPGEDGGRREPLSSGEMVREAKAALIGLGFKEQEVGSMIQRVLTSDEGARPKQTEELIRTALRQLSV